MVARTAAFVYIYARIPQIVEMTLSFHATMSKLKVREITVAPVSCLLKYLKVAWSAIDWQPFEAKKQGPQCTNG